MGVAFCYVNKCLCHWFNPTRVRCLKTTGQIQNPQDFFEAGIAEVPPENCSNSGFEFGARVRGANLRSEELGTEETSTFASCEPGGLSPRSGGRGEWRA
jgi:hypothetical protein